MAKGMQGRSRSMAILLDREVRTSTDPADFDPFYAQIFPKDDFDLEQERLEAELYWVDYYEEELDDLYYRTGWGPRPERHDDKVDEFDPRWDHPLDLDPGLAFNPGY